jgi:hypothetical protein
VTAQNGQRLARVKPIIALAKISEVEDLVCSTGGC